MYHKNIHYSFSSRVSFLSLICGFGIATAKFKGITCRKRSHHPHHHGVTHRTLIIIFNNNISNEGIECPFAKREASLLSVCMCVRSSPLNSVKDSQCHCLSICHPQRFSPPISSTLSPFRSNKT